MDGQRALIGASAENACGVNSGAAYIFERDSEKDLWQRVARLVASDCEPGDFFGRSLALSGDRALVASAESFFDAERSNIVYVFERDSISGAWNETTRLTAESRHEEGAFGTSVSLDGDRALVTTSGDPSTGRHGGAAYVFHYESSVRSWRREARLVPADTAPGEIFGGNGALQGDRAIVAASTYFRYDPGSIYTFERDPYGVWREKDRIPNISDFFISLDLDGDLLLVGESKGERRGAGAASLFKRIGGGWERIQRLRPVAPYDHGAFGTTVSLDADCALVVGYDEQLGLSRNIDRVVFVFTRDPDTGTFRQSRVIDIGHVSFGSSVDHKGPFAVIGRASEQVAGAAYVARLANGLPESPTGEMD